jgi:ABC-2 type transport system ATP-binding protein
MGLGAGPKPINVKLVHVSKSFGKLVALDHVCLDVGAGERVAFVGPNGSGKTTLLRARLGLVRVEGCVLVDGVDVAKAPEIALRSVAHIPQIAPPLDAPLGDVLEAWSALRRRPVDAVRARASRMGLDLERWTRARFRDLSGGMKQKVLASMALAAEARVLVCDEPTANLDEEARASFFDQERELPAQTVVVLCSHRVDEVRSLVKRVVELRDGRVARDGSLDEMMLTVGRLARERATLRAVR